MFIHVRFSSNLQYLIFAPRSPQPVIILCLLGSAPVAAQLVLEVPGAAWRSIDGGDRQITVSRVSDVEEVGICVAVCVAMSASIGGLYRFAMFRTYTKK